MRCLVTGAGGFVGRHLVSRLRSQGVQVLGLGLGGEVSQDDPAYRVVDVLDYPSLASHIREFRPQWIVHLAALVQPRESVERPLPYFQVNVLGTLHVLEAVRLHRKQARLLVVSSSEVYGRDRKEPRRETDPCDPPNPYALSKLMAEWMARQYVRLYGLSVVIARPFNHCGPGQPSGFVVADFCRQVAEAEAGLQPPLVRTGNLAARRDFLDVRDVVRAYQILLERGSSGGLYNVCSGREVSMGELLESIRRLSHLSLEVESSREGDSGTLVGDNSRLRSLGWEPRISLEETLRETLESWRRSLRNK